MLHSCLCKVLGDPGFNPCCLQFSFTLCAFSARSHYDEVFGARSVATQKPARRFLVPSTNGGCSNISHIYTLFPYGLVASLWPHRLMKLWRVNTMVPPATLRPDCVFPRWSWISSVFPWRSWQPNNIIDIKTTCTVIHASLGHLGQWHKQLRWLQSWANTLGIFAKSMRILICIHGPNNTEMWLVDVTR